MCPIRKDTSPKIKKRSSHSRNTPPASENSIPNPNHSGAPCNPLEVHKYANSAAITAGLATNSNFRLGFHTASAVSAAKTNAASKKYTSASSYCKASLRGCSPQSNLLHGEGGLLTCPGGRCQGRREVRPPRNDENLL